MALIKTTDELKQYLKIDANFNPQSILPFIAAAEAEIIRLLGKELFSKLDGYYNDEGDGENDELNAILIYVQRPLAWFAMMKGLDNLNVVITSNGLAVVQNNNLVPASKQRRDDLMQSISENAWDNMEALLEFLEENISDYPEWEESDAYAYQYQYLISSARKFNDLYPINRSRLTFLSWRHIMADVELLQMEPVVSKDFMDELKTQIKEKSVTEANQPILDKLQKALAYLTVGDLPLDKTEESKCLSITNAADIVKMNSEAYKRKGTSYLMLVKQMLDAAPDDYPTYKASSVYDSTVTSYQKYENDSTSNIVVL